MNIFSDYLKDKPAVIPEAIIEVVENEIQIKKRKIKATKRCRECLNPVSKPHKKECSYHVDKSGRSN